MRSGYADLGGGTLRFAGANGDYWSNRSVSSGTIFVYHFFFDASDSYASNGNYARYSALSVRYNSYSLTSAFSR